MRNLVLGLSLGLFIALSSTAIASDHADPIRLKDPLEPGLTGLFAFRDGGQLVLILNTYRGLSFDPPYYLEPFEYQLHIDWHSQVNFKDVATLKRYGGQVITPESIKEDATITFRLNNDASLASHNIVGLQTQSTIKVWSGVRDDPFIFPRFFGTNVISMAVRIPLSSFPASAKNFLIWGSSHKVSSSNKLGKQIDAVGRANRSQLARLDFLNILTPSEQANELSEKLESSQKRYEFLNKWVPPLASLYELVFQVRRYDTEVDVMIYRLDTPDSYPNGRLLTDDVAALSCEWGDCPLQEVAYIEGNDFPRQTQNDKTFLVDFPYLAKPWPGKGHAPDHTHFKWRWLAYLIIIALFCRYTYRRVRSRKS